MTTLDALVYIKTGIDFLLSEELKRIPAQDRPEKLITPDEIIECCAKLKNITVEEIKGPSRKKDVNIARQCAMYLIRTNVHMSLKETAALFNRSHALVHVAMTNIEGELEIYEKRGKDYRGVGLFIESVARLCNISY